MDGRLEGLEDFFEDFKRRQEAAKQEALARLKKEQENFGSFKTSAQRRARMKHQKTEDVTRLAHEMAIQLSEISGERKFKI
jgi:hypothetical protein